MGKEEKDVELDGETLLLLAHWSKLKPNARRCMLHVVQQLISDYTGTVRWQCNKGGVRKVFLEQEFNGNEVEVVLGEE